MILSISPVKKSQEKWSRGFRGKDVVCARKAERRAKHSLTALYSRNVWASEMPRQVRSQFKNNFSTEIIEILDRRMETKSQKKT